jgi:hypothetical protein
MVTFGCAVQLCSDSLREAFAVDGEGAAGRHLVFRRRGNDQPVRPAHLFVQHADRV